MVGRRLFLWNGPSLRDTLTFQEVIDIRWIMEIWMWSFGTWFHSRFHSGFISSWQFLTIAHADRTISIGWSMCWRQHPLKTGREKKRPWYPRGCPYTFHSHNQQGRRNCIWRCLWQSYPCKGSIKSVPCRGASCGNIQFSAGFVQRQEGPSFLAANGTPDLIFAKLFLKLNWNVELVSTVLTYWLQGSLRDQLPIFIARLECNLRYEMSVVVGSLAPSGLVTSRVTHAWKESRYMFSWHCFARNESLGPPNLGWTFFLGCANLASFRGFVWSKPDMVGDQSWHWKWWFSKGPGEKWWLVGFCIVGP